MGYDACDQFLAPHVNCSPPSEALGSNDSICTSVAHIAGLDSVGDSFAMTRCRVARRTGGPYGQAHRLAAPRITL